ncbi:MAG: anthranilate phosphoribosyltransferase [Pseudomonadota bacterium]
MRELLDKVASREDLSEAEMAAAMNQIMNGEATQAQMGALLLALRTKGETVEELAAAASVMRQRATRVQASREPLIDTCGTGGDGVGTFNVSTACAFAAAAAGAGVAKHGNRSVSSQSGSADVLEAAGVNLDLSADAVGQCIDEIGVGFMFAPAHHGATRFAVPVRRELGVRTLFNLLGPMTNPAFVRRQVMGVYSPRWVEPVARVLAKLGAEHVMVVHADDGLDEISPAAPTQVAEYKDGELTLWTIDPNDHGIAVDLAAIAADSPERSLDLLRDSLTRSLGPAAAVVALNAGAAIYVAGLAESFADGVAAARQVQNEGSGWERLQALAALSSKLAASAAESDPAEPSVGGGQATDG